MAGMNLDLIVELNNHDKFTRMIDTLYNNTITRPINKYQKIITQREELIRIKSAMTTSTLETSARKVTNIIMRELPAERPVLAGLIREETEKNTSELKRKLQSALDQIERNKRTLKLLCTQNSKQPHTEDTAKNARSSNMTW